MATQKFIFKKLPLSSNKMLNQLDFKFKKRMWSLQVLLILRKKECIPLMGTCGCSQSSMHLILTAYHIKKSPSFSTHMSEVPTENCPFLGAYIITTLIMVKKTDPKPTTIITEHRLCPSPFARKERLHELCPEIL